MVDETKRKMLLFPLVLPCIPVFASVDLGVTGREDKNRKAEFQYVYTCWKKKFNYEPDYYLRTQGVTLQDDKEHILTISKRDFRQGDTVEINGFILSKIETALIAATGKMV